MTRKNLKETDGVKARISTFRAVVFLISATILPSKPCPAQPALGVNASSAVVEAFHDRRIVRNGAFGFAFNPPEDWTPVPVPVREPYILYRFRAPGVDYPPGELHRAQVPNLTVTAWKPGTREGRNASASETPVEIRDRAARLKRLLPESTPPQVYARFRELDLDGKARLDFTLDASPTRESRLRIRNTLIFIPLRKCIVVLLLRCLESMADSKYALLFDETAQSCREFEVGMPLSSRAVSGLNERERILEDKIGRLPPGWRYRWADKKRYLLFANTDPAATEKAGRALSRLRDLFEAIFPCGESTDRVPVIRVCRTYPDYLALGGKAGTWGYWSDEDYEMVLSAERDARSIEGSRTLRHEAFHQFIHERAGGPPAPWLDEGFAEYFEASERTDAGWEFKKNPACLGRLIAAMKSKETIPLGELLSLPSDPYQEPASLARAQAWSLAYFLRHGGEGSGDWCEEWGSIPIRYLLNLIRARASSTVLLASCEGPYFDTPERNRRLNRYAVRRTFDGWTDGDWERLERAWFDFFR